MIGLVLLAGLALALASPHAVRLDDAPPSLAAIVWLAALLLRAATVLFAAIFVFVVAPATDLFHAVTHLCWHTVVPLATTHLGVSGHLLADAAVLLPVVVVLWSLASVGVALLRAARRVRHLLAAGIGRGPRDSVIVSGGDVLLAAAGIRRPRVIVSAGALTQLDDAELQAGLDHEHGHIEHRHRWVLVIAYMAHAVGRPIPGARAALTELSFHLERDADRFALEREHEACDLASAICKAAGAERVEPVLGLAGGGAARRVRNLLEDETPNRRAMMPRVLAAALIGLTLTVLAAVGPATIAAADTFAAHPPADCPD